MDLSIIKDAEIDLNRGAFVIKTFKEAKEKGMDPIKLAEEKAREIGKIKGIKKVEVKGGYINIYPSPNTMIKPLKTKKEEKKVMIEFPSVNPNKPWHIGHLRNALLGESISRIASYLGYKVIKIDYIDDLGLQIAESFWYWQKKGKEEPCKEKFDHCIGKQYVEAHKLAEKNQEEIKEMLIKLEKGLTEAREFAEKVVKAQYETAFTYGIYHDYLIFESDVAKLLEKGYEWLKQQEVIKYITEGKNKGCWVIEMPPGFMGLKDNQKVLIRSDGTATYTGKDVIFHLWKAGKLGEFLYKPFIKQPNGKTAYASSPTGEKKNVAGADILINVIGKEQEFPQAVVKEVLKKLNIKVKHIHLSYGAVRLKDAKFSGRKGTWIGYTADELFNEGLKKLKEEHNKMQREIVMAAISYAFLSVHRLKEVIFDWNKALTFQGKSGPYIQYSYVRANSLLEKTAEKTSGEFSGKLKEEEEKLLFYLYVSDLKVKESFDSLSPHTLAHFIGEIAKLFNSIYETTPILKEKDEERRKDLIKLTEIFKERMENLMHLILIPPIKRM